MQLTLMCTKVYIKENMMTYELQITLHSVFSKCYDTTFMTLFTQTCVRMLPCRICFLRPLLGAAKTSLKQQVVLETRVAIPKSTLSSPQIQSGSHFPNLRNLQLYIVH